MDDILAEIVELELTLKETKDFIEKMELKDKILELRRSAGLVKPPDSPYECEGCSA
jgi:hypothetical protein